MKKLLTELRFLDESGHVSLTNLSVLVELARLLLSPVGAPAGWEIAALCAVLAHYSAKKLLTLRASANDDATKAIHAKFEQDLAEIRNKVGGLSLAVGLKPK